jgi:hypothetical protein
VPGGQLGQLCQLGWGAGVMPGQPLVGQAEGEADAAGDGGGGAVGGFGLGLIQDRGRELGVTVSDGLGGQPARGAFSSAARSGRQSGWSRP